MFFQLLCQHLNRRTQERIKKETASSPFSFDPAQFFFSNILLRKLPLKTISSRVVKDTQKKTHLRTQTATSRLPDLSSQEMPSGPSGTRHHTAAERVSPGWKGPEKKNGIHSLKNHVKISYRRLDALHRGGQTEACPEKDPRKGWDVNNNNKKTASPPLYSVQRTFSECTYVD